MRLLKAWAGLTALITAAWLLVLLLVFALNLLLPATPNTTLRALLGLILLGGWIACMALLVETVRRRIGRA